MLSLEIEKMYRDIDAYRGDFGDGVETGSYDPVRVLSGNGNSEYEIRGAAVAVLCNLQLAVDNSTWDDAKASRLAAKARSIFGKANSSIPEPVSAAFAAFLESENAFNEALGRVHSEVVVPELRRIGTPK